MVVASFIFDFGIAVFDFYTHYLSTHYLKEKEHLATIYRKRYYLWRSKLKDFLPPNKKAPVLEVGCGMGQNLYALRELGYQDVRGIDLSRECVELCQKQNFAVTQVERGSRFYQEHPHKFELVILYDLLEHLDLEEAVKLLQDVSRSLTESGKLFISTPNGDHPFQGHLRYADVTHRFLYNRRSLSQLLRSSGFEPLRFRQLDAFTEYDDDRVRYFLKKFFLKPLSWAGEHFWKLVAFSQGIYLRECKPTLVCLAKLF